MLVHGTRYDYSMVTEDHVKGCLSYVPIRCTICEYEWHPCITNHLRGNRCLSCTGKIRITLLKFVQRTEQIHGATIDTSNVTEADMMSPDRKIPLICGRCQRGWRPLIYNVLKGRGCPACNGRLPMTYERLMIDGPRFHGDKFDYSRVTSDHVENAFSRIPLICNICKYTWSPMISNHIYHKTGCPVCRSSRGEHAIMVILNSFGVIFTSQHRIPELPTRRFDFGFSHEGREWMIEFDGIQHFQPVDRFDRDHDSFERRNASDRIKTYIAVQTGRNIIRIDHTVRTEADMFQHLRRAFELDQPIYYSNPGMYDYLQNFMYTREFVQQYAPIYHATLDPEVPFATALPSFAPIERQPEPLPQAPIISSAPPRLTLNVVPSE